MTPPEVEQRGGFVRSVHDVISMIENQPTDNVDPDREEAVLAARPRPG
jgi:hypothetical protein